MRTIMKRSLALAAGITLAAFAAAGPAAAANAPQPPGPVPTKQVTTTTTTKVLVASTRIDTPFGSNEACGRAAPQYLFAGPWTEYKCSQTNTYTWWLRLYDYDLVTTTTTTTVPMVWQVVAREKAGAGYTFEACDRTGSSLKASSTTWNGWECQYVSNIYSGWYDLYMTRSAWV